jgi:hypothetical protein
MDMERSSYKGGVLYLKLILLAGKKKLLLKCSSEGWLTKNINRGIR